MPIYEYACTACAHEMEVLQKMSDPVLTDCPTCGASALVKKVSAAGFRLAGSGWYETDFKSAGKRNLAADQKDSKGGADATKSDAKSGGTESATPAKPAGASPAKPAAAPKADA